jgi:hypothetical protein
MSRRRINPSAGKRRCTACGELRDRVAVRTLPGVLREATEAEARELRMAVHKCLEATDRLGAQELLRKDHEARKVRVCISCEDKARRGLLAPGIGQRLRDRLGAGGAS